MTWLSCQKYSRCKRCKNFYYFHQIKIILISGYNQSKIYAINISGKNTQQYSHPMLAEKNWASAWTGTRIDTASGRSKWRKALGEKVNGRNRIIHTTDNEFNWSHRDMKGLFFGKSAYGLLEKWERDKFQLLFRSFFQFKKNSPFVISW